MFLDHFLRSGIDEQDNSKQLVQGNGDHVVELTSATFKEFLKNNEYVMVDFVSSSQGRQGSTWVC